MQNGRPYKSGRVTKFDEKAAKFILVDFAVFLAINRVKGTLQLGRFVFASKSLLLSWVRTVKGLVQSGLPEGAQLFESYSSSSCCHNT